MASYIDGFAFPIASEHVSTYRKIAEQVGEIYLEHGAIDYVEFVGDDLQREGTMPFPSLLPATEGETVIFGWIVFESRESRDLVNQKVETDPRMHELLSPLLHPSDPIFDPSRMAYGGFTSLIRIGKSSECLDENQCQPKQ